MFVRENVLLCFKLTIFGCPLVCLLLPAAPCLSGVIRYSELMFVKAKPLHSRVQ